MKKPISRSSLRRTLGKFYYRILKTYYWYFSRFSFSKIRTQNSTPYTIFEHKTVLLRKLQGLDMQLQYNKINNLQIAIEKINDTVLFPHERFSYWREIGKPSKSKGYKKGLILTDGKIGEGIGGGLCQLSNLIFWMIAHSPLTVLERWRHSYDVFPDSKRTLPFGSGATCSYPYIDLQFANNTEYTFSIEIYLDGTYLHGKIMCSHDLPLVYEIYEKDHNFSPTGWGGYIRSNELYRKITDKKTGEILEDSFFIKNEALTMYDPLIE